MPDLDLVCLGEPLLELNLQPADATGRRSYLEGHGGDAANVAVAAARSGARVAMLTALGDDLAGRSFGELWRREGVDTSAVRVVPDRPTGLYFVTHGTDGHHFSYLRRGSAAARYRLDAAAREVIERSPTLFASGISLGISEVASDTVFEAMDLARAAGRDIAFDTNYRPKLWPARRAAALIREAIGRATVVFPGIEDCRLLFDEHDPDAVADLCLGLGARLVAVKMGAAGALLATAEARTRIAPFLCSPVDATGAGDTFCGAFLARIAEGHAGAEAARFAACAAALSTMGYGAVPPIPTRNEVLATLEGSTIRL